MGMAWRKRGIGSFISYTDKRTALFEPTSSSLLDANVSITLGSPYHDQANQICQHSSRRPKSRLGFLHGETWIHDHHRSAFRRQTALDRIANSKSGDEGGIIHGRRRGKANRLIHEHVVHLR